MKKAICLIGILMILSVGCNLKNIIEARQKSEPEPVYENLKQEVLSKTYSISKEYLTLRFRTDNLLVNAEMFVDYQQWDKEMGDIIKGWKELEQSAAELESLSKEFASEESAFSVELEEPGIVYARHSIGINYQSYEKYELSNVFDNAPAGKKIATLAKYLGTDAKRAYGLLQQEQGIITADAYNEAGDTLQKLETTAVVIKDTCKVAGFVIATHLSGGMGPTLIEQASFIIGGADMVLEIGEDGANIALGNNNKVSAIIGDARKITEPVASILTLTTTSFDKSVNIVNAFMFEADQLRSGFQDGKIMGISIPIPGTKKEDLKTPDYKPTKRVTEESDQELTEEVAQPVIASVFEPEEIDQWFENNNIPMVKETITEADIADALGIKLPNQTEASAESANTKPTPLIPLSQEEVNPENLIDLSGAWAIHGVEDESLYNVNLSCDEDRAYMMTWATIEFLPLIIMSGQFEFSAIDGTYHFIDHSDSEHLTTTGSARMVNEEINLEMTFSESEQAVFDCDFAAHDACEWYTYPGSTVCKATFKEYSTPEPEMEFQGYHPIWKLSGGTLTCTYDRAIWQYRVSTLGVDDDIRYPCLGTVTVPDVKAYIYDDLPDFSDMFSDY